VSNLIFKKILKYNKLLCPLPLGNYPGWKLYN
jgi:hypothetical protein